jgi:hypothetical protein
MAKKSKTTKKHRFKYTEPAGLKTVQSAAVTAEPVASGSVTAKAVKQPVTASAIAVGRDFSYVVTDLRRLGVLMAGLVALEAVLWYLLNHTGVGDVVFNLIQV